MCAWHTMMAGSDVFVMPSLLLMVLLALVSLSLSLFLSLLLFLLFFFSPLCLFLLSFICRSFLFLSFLVSFSYHVAGTNRNCKVNNGGCDWHVECHTNSSKNNSISCGPCPIGFLGDGYNGCEGILSFSSSYFSFFIFFDSFFSLFFLLMIDIAQCGNGVCEKEMQEDCVSCPADCTTFPCGMFLLLDLLLINLFINFNLLLLIKATCGDRTCEPGRESCNTCPEDCGLCRTSLIIITSIIKNIILILF